MSVYRTARSPYWHFDFQLKGSRFHGSTKARNRREAEAVERQERERAKLHLAQMGAAATSLRLDDVCGRYWHEVGQHHAAARDTWRQLNYLIQFFGKDKLLTEITNNDAVKLVAWRRGHKARTRNGAATDRLVSFFTVNDLTKQLKKLFMRAKLWGVRFDHELHWRKLWLEVPPERVRELADDEAERLDLHMRADYAPFFAFARATGLRLRECLLKWSEVDWGAKQIRKLGKGGRVVTTPINNEVRSILWPLRGHDAVYVFTYIAETTRNGKVRGRRYPITYNGLESMWKRLRLKAGVEGFRFHDFRHDLGTKLLRKYGNLKLVQRTLNHSDIKTTTRYAHVLDSEVAEALDELAKSRNRSRTPLREVS